MPKLWKLIVNKIRIYSLKQQQKILRDLVQKLQIEQGQYPEDSTYYREIEWANHNLVQVNLLLSQITGEESPK